MEVAKANGVVISVSPRSSVIIYGQVRLENIYGVDLDIEVLKPPTPLFLAAQSVAAQIEQQASELSAAVDRENVVHVRCVRNK
jgi:hypothetical protein